MAILNKKGSGILDIFSIVLFIMFFTLIAGISLFVWGQWNDSWQAADIVPDRSKTETAKYDNLFTNVMDGAIIFFMAILWIGTLVSAYYLDNSPIWFVIFLVFGLVAFFALIPIANIVVELGESGLGNDGFDLLPMSMFVYENLALFITGFLLTVGVALYMKRQQGEMYG